MRGNDTRRAQGFTIVELLIVIVVIGILAAITIVTYNGIQAKAKVAATLSAVDGFEKILRMYKEVHGFYPESGGYACLGGPYPATAAIGAGKCWINPSATVAQTRPTVDTALAEFSSSAVKVDMTEYNVDTNVLRGVNYYGASYNGDTTNQSVNISYALGASNVCGRGYLTTISSGSGSVPMCSLQLSSFVIP